MDFTNVSLRVENRVGYITINLINHAVPLDSVLPTDKKMAEGIDLARSTSSVSAP